MNSLKLKLSCVRNSNSSDTYVEDFQTNELKHFVLSKSLFKNPDVENGSLLLE